MSAAAVTGSELMLEGVIQSHLNAVTSVFEDSGCDIKFDCGNLLIKAPERLKPLPVVRTMPYPGFPTDAQAVMMSAACAADGASVFVENIFEDRFKHVSELTRMGADIKVENRVAVVNGVKKLYGAEVRARDLRGAAALVTAALAAEGETTIDGICYLDRGYEDFELVLGSLGADIKRI